MQNRLVIIGASGHGKVIADIASKCGYQDIVFLDDNATGSCMGFPIVGSVPEVEMLNDGATDFIIAIGNNEIRKRIATSCDVNWVTLVHPDAVIGAFVQIGKGTVVMAGAVINAGAVVGAHCIVNSGAVVEHDDVLENYVHISPGAVLGGAVFIGECTHIGIGVTVKNNLNICGHCRIGAGAVVVKNIDNSATYVGIPAKIFFGGGRSNI